MIPHPRERGHIPDWTKIGILRLRSLTGDGVIVEGDHLIHAELRLARFDLDARPFATAYECDKQLV
jgi:hypothetical protein